MDEREMRTNRKKKCPSHWLHEEGREKGETERAKDGKERGGGENWSAPIPSKALARRPNCETRHGCGALVQG